MRSHRWKMEELPFTEEQMQRAERMYFSVQQNVFCSRQEVLKAVTFDELFEKTKAIPWENYIPKNGKFWVAKASSVKM